MVQMLDSWSVEEREHSIAKMMLMDVDKSPKAIEGCSQGRRLLSNLKGLGIISAHTQESGFKSQGTFSTLFTPLSWR